MSVLESMYMKKLCLVSDTMGNKSVIRDGENGYACDTAEDYAARIRSAMKRFPTELTEQAYRDVLNTYNTETMAFKFISFHKREIQRSHTAQRTVLNAPHSNSTRKDKC